MTKKDYDKYKEELAYRAFDALDRHELTKFLEGEGIEVYNYESNESVREKAKTLYKALAKESFTVEN